MLIDKIAKLTGKVVRGVTQTVGTVGETIYDEVRSVPSAFVDGLTDGQGFAKKETPEMDETSENTANTKCAENNTSHFKNGPF